MTGMLAAGTVGVRSVQAHDVSTYPPILMKLAKNFKLSENEVFEVLAEIQADRHAKVLSKFEDRLDNAVEEGKITVEQKYLLMDKYEEFHAKLDELKSKKITPSQKRQEVIKMRTELRAWSKTQGIDYKKYPVGKAPGML